MRVTIAALAAATTVTVGAAAAPPVRVTVTAGTHQPRVGVRWWYTVHAARGGRPVSGRLTVQILDPLGAAHPVELGSTKRRIVRLPFAGVFRDYIIWPASSRGIPLTVRATLSAAGTKSVAQYQVTPRR